MTSIVFAALSALVWGTADYCGGRATGWGNNLPGSTGEARPMSRALGVTVVSQILGLPVLVVGVVLLPGVLHTSDLAWGAGAGAAGTFGIVLLYRSLSTGAMAVAAPITAVTGALVPMIFGLLVERLPSTVALTGASCAVIAIALVSLGPAHSGGRVTPRVVGLALASGGMFGIFFVLLAQTHDDSGMWPLVAARALSVPLGLVLVALAGASLRMPRAIVGWVAFAGIGDIAANATYLLAIRAGLLTLVAPIVALYPVSTVLLALALDKERVRPIQIAGLALAAAALVLTAV